MNDQTIDIQHRLWLDQPVTKLLSKVLSKHKELIINSIANESQLTTEESDKKLRQLAVQLKTTNTLIKLIYDTASFTSRAISD